MNGQSRGLWVAVLSATSLGFITTFARMTYDAGSNPLTIVLFRSALGCFLVLALVLAARKSLRIPKQARPTLLVCGLGLAMISFGYMSAVAYIPVGLAAIIFYTFPLMVLAFEAVQDRRPPGPRRITVFVCAFIGLMLVIGPSFESLDWRGIAFALLGAFGTLVMFVSGRNLGDALSPQVSAIYTNLIVIPIALVIICANDAFQLPQTPIGWWAIIGVAGAYLIGVVTQLTAVSLAKATDVALVFNAEPVVSIAFAWVMLGETLSMVQMTGVTLVIGAICFGARLGASQSRIPGTSKSN